MGSNNICRGRALRIAVEFTVLAILLLVGGAGAAPSEQWNKTFGGTGYDSATSVQKTTDGGYILAGWTESYGAGRMDDAWLIKTDAAGIEQWNRTFGGAYFDSAYSVQQTTDGGYIIAGVTSSCISGECYDAWLIKTDANGNEQWNKTFGGAGDERAFFVQQTTDSGYILAGWTESYGAGRMDAWLIKTDTAGIEQWNRTFGGAYFDLAEAVQQTTDGGFILAGSYGAGYSDAWLIKTDAAGIEQWNRTFGGILNNEGKSVKQTSDGGYAFAGVNESEVGWNAWLIKTDANGNQQWSKSFGANSEWANSVQQTIDGGYIVAGAYNAETIGAWLIKTDASGNEQWNRTFGGTGWDIATSVQQTSDSGYILAGETDSYGAGNRDAWLIKVSSGDTKPNIKSFAPPSPVNDVEGATRTFSIITNQTVNVSWLINGIEVFNETGGVTEALYTNTSAAEGTWNVTAVVTNANGTAVQTWNWIVTPIPTAGSISGYKVNDTNGNGNWDASEKGISNWTIRLIGITGKGKDTKVVRKETFTDAMGFYKFDNLSAGRYFVIEKLKKGFVPTSSPVKRIKLAQDENSMNNNFTNRPVHSKAIIDGQRDMDDYEVINRDIDKYKENMD